MNDANGPIDISNAAQERESDGVVTTLFYKLINVLANTEVILFTNVRTRGWNLLSFAIDFPAKGVDVFLRSRSILALSSCRRATLLSTYTMAIIPQFRRVCHGCKRLLTDIPTVHNSNVFCDTSFPRDVDSINADATRALPNPIWSKARPEVSL
jgi:hypothetical protein